MALDQLSADERETVLRCLRAVHDGYIPEWELFFLLGLHKEELAAVIAAWPEVEAHPHGPLAINNSLAAICFIRVQPEEWNRWFDLPREEVRRLYRKWRALRGEPPPLRYYDVIE